MTKDEALKMRKEQDEYWSKIIKQAEEALEQSAQEPLAWLSTNSIANEVIKSCSAPSWQGLSDDEILELKIKHVDYELFDEGEYGTECSVYVDDFYHAIEAKLKEKNHG